MGPPLNDYGIAEYCIAEQFAFTFGRFEALCAAE